MSATLTYRTSTSRLLDVVGNIFLIVTVPAISFALLFRALELRQDYRLLLTGKYSRQEAQYQKFARSYGISRLAWDYFRSYAETIVSTSDEAVEYSIKYHRIHPNDKMRKHASIIAAGTFAYLVHRLASEGTNLGEAYDKLVTEALLLFTAKHFKLDRENADAILEVYADMKKVYDPLEVSPPEGSENYLDTPLERGFLGTLKALGLNTDDPEIIRNSADLYGHWVKNFGVIAEAHRSFIQKIHRQAE